jgi:hypothetical protein
MINNDECGEIGEIILKGTEVLWVTCLRAILSTANFT